MFYAREFPKDIGVSHSVLPAAKDFPIPTGLPYRELVVLTSYIVCRALCYPYISFALRRDTTNNFFLFVIMSFMSAILLACLIGLVASQRPSYVPNPVRYPDVAPRFRVSTSTEAVDVGNRNGVPTETTTTERLPIDARGNVDLINQFKNWPEDKLPYWYINYKLIEQARNQAVQGAADNGQQLQQVNTQSRSSFLS